MKLSDRMLASEIHVHLLDDRKVNSSDLIAAFERLLTPEEIEKRCQFKFPEHRHQYLVTRALVRSTLTGYFPRTAPADWRFIATEYGRPMIKGVNRNIFDFNVSHTEGCIVLVVSAGRSPGVDVERNKQTTDFLEIAQRFFTGSEYRYLKDQPVEARQRCFLDLWTLKEAFVKANGLGLSLRLNDFAFDLRRNGRLGFKNNILDCAQKASWKFWAIDFSSEYALALAIDASVRPKVRLFESLPLGTFQEIDLKIRYQN